MAEGVEVAEVVVETTLSVPLGSAAIVGGAACSQLSAPSTLPTAEEQEATFHRDSSRVQGLGPARSFESKSFRPRRGNAGSRLKEILEEKMRDETPTNTSEPEVDEVSNLTGASGPGAGESPSTDPSCCVCSEAAPKALEGVVHCRAPLCTASAHCACAGYTVKGAKTAKFYCPSCQAKKLLAKPASKTKSRSPFLTSGQLSYYKGKK